MLVTLNSMQGKGSHPALKQFDAISSKIRSYPKAELIRCLKIVRLETEGRKAELITRLEDFYKNTMHSMHETQTENDGRINVMLDFYIVIDFEATCEVAGETPSSFQ